MHFVPIHMTLDSVDPDIEEWLFMDSEAQDHSKETFKKSFYKAGIVDAIEGKDYVMKTNDKLSVASWTLIAIAAAFAVGALASSFTWWIMTKM